MKPKILTILEISAIILVGLITIKWFGGDYIIGGGDFAFPADPETFFRLSTHTWDYYSSTGAPASRNIAAIMPYSLLLLFMDRLGLSIYNIEKIMFFIWFVSAGLSMYALAFVLKINRYGRLFASLLYMINPFSIIVVYHVAHGLLFPIYSFLPLLLALFIYGLNNNKKIDYVIISNLVILITISNSFVNPSLFIVSSIPLLLYGLYYLIANLSDRIKVRRLVYYNICFFLIMGLLNLFWILPMVTSIAESNAQASNVVEYTNRGPFLDDLRTFELNSGKLLDLFRLMGLWSVFAQPNSEDYYYTWSNTYQSAFFVFLSYLLPLLVIVSLLTRKNHNDAVTYLMILFMLALFLNKGHNEPFLNISSLLFEKIGLITRMFRGAILKFGFLLALSAAPLIGEAVGTIVSNIKNRAGKLRSALALTLVLFMFIVILGFPVWTGSVIQQPQKFYSGLRFKIPADYMEFSAWDSAQTDEFRYIHLPLPVSYNVVYWWGDSGYIGGDFMRWFSRHPTVSVNMGEFHGIPKIFAKNMNALDCSDFDLKLLGLMNVKYFQYHKDTDWIFLDLAPDSFFMKNRYVMENCLKEYNLSLVFSSNNLDIYKIPAEYIRPKLYAINGFNTYKNISFVDSGYENSTVKDFVLLDQNKKMDIGKTKTKKESKKEATAFFPIDYIKISPVKYSFCIEDKKEKNFLVFSETFNKNWKVYITLPDRSSWLKVLYMKPLPEENHFIINSFANAWNITGFMQQKSEKCHLSGIIYYKPQIYFYIGLIVSLVSLSISAIFLLYKNIKTRSEWS